jgi:putative two-component system response regulator
MGHIPKILIVDDEEAVRCLFKETLVHLGYQALVAADGREALEILAEESPDVVLTDVKMPRMDGFELCHYLKSREETRGIPVVVVTGLTELGDRIRALEVGADDFLSKPVHQTELEARVRSLVKVKAYHDHMLNYQQELENEVAKKTRELHQAFEDTKRAYLEAIFRLTRAAEYKDEDTGAHIQRMSHYAAAIARRMGLGEEVMENIIYAVPMHDVGKIGIPDRILTKPGELEPDEWEIMKQHTTIGARILEGSTIEFIKLAEVIALTHHEKWDGSGYPHGLSGTSIPLASRITAIADVFDAVTSNRPYRAPFQVERALHIIREGRRSHFDPEVVDVFFAVKGEMLAIKEEYKDQEANLLVS